MRPSSLWFHVDGSLGGFGVLDAGVRPRYAGMAEADSLSLDPHKWLGVPIDCATVLVRDMATLRDTFSLVPSYLRARPGDRPWFSEYVFDQTRPFRALKLWMTLAAAGRDGVAARVSRNVGLAHRLAAQVDAASELELLAEPVLNVVVFRHRGCDEAGNHAIPLRLQAGGDVFLTGALVGGREATRACVMHEDTTEADIDRMRAGRAGGRRRGHATGVTLLDDRAGQAGCSTAVAGSPSTAAASMGTRPSTSVGRLRTVW